MSAPAELEPMTTPGTGPAMPAVATRPALKDFFQLAKPRITLLVVLTTLVGFLEARRGGAINVELLLHTLLGTALVAAAASTLNQWGERTADAAMRRTAQRPLPAGRLSPAQALWFGLALLVVGTAWLAAFANPLAALLAAFTAASYLLAYTPLKPVTPLATLVGAVPGAIPPMIGWAAARGSLDAGAWVLFLIVFLWQMPHFLAIATLYRQDYARAGFRVLAVVDEGGTRTARESVFYAALLVPVSVMPSFIGLAGRWYLAGALLLSLAYVWYSARLLPAPQDVTRARTLFRFSLIYLPVLLILLVTL